MSVDVQTCQCPVGSFRAVDCKTAVQLMFTVTANPDVKWTSALAVAPEMIVGSRMGYPDIVSALAAADAIAVALENPDLTPVQVLEVFEWGPGVGRRYAQGGAA